MKLLLLLALLQVSPAGTNTTCPVMVDEPVKGEYASIYNGRQVFFCCAVCQAKFITSPDKYVKNLPEVYRVLQTGNAHDPFALVDAPLMLDQTLPAIVTAAVLVILRMALWKRAGPRASGRFPRTARVLGVVSHPAAALGILLSAVLLHVAFRTKDVFQLGRQAAMDSAAANDELQVLQWMETWHHSLQDVSSGPSLQRTYYRGNDERSPKLYNGGVYRTCTFRLSVRTDEGRVAAPADVLSGRSLEVLIEIERAPGTAEELFEEGMMAGFALVPGTGPRLLRINPLGPCGALKSVEPRKRWAAPWPLGRVEAGRNVPMTGILYLGPTAQLASSMTGMGAHYWIRYAIPFKDGKVGAEASISMGALLQISNLPGAEWLSDKPMPEIPADWKAPEKTSPPPKRGH